jgi:uncharacterized protein
MSTASTEAQPAPNVVDAVAPPVPAPAYGDPFSLGLVSFGLSALVLAAVNSGRVDASATPAVMALAIPLGFFTELIAGLIHYRRGETFAATVFTAYAGFWISFYFIAIVFLPKVTAANGPTSTILGWYLLAWAIFTTYMFLASLKVTITVAAILGLLAIVFWTLCIGTFNKSTGLSHFSGYVLFVDAALALFLSAASVINEAWGRVVVPAP